jgi:hypothetical protein
MRGSFKIELPYRTIKRLGGSCEIRTHGGLSSSPVFKTGAFNRSAKLPFCCALNYKEVHGINLMRHS